METIQIFNYNNSDITIKNENGNVYVNLTEIAKAFPEKNLSQILNTQAMSDYVEKLAEIRNVTSADLLRVTKGGNPNEQGTWAHQKVALRVCQYLSTDFAILVDTKIEELISKGYTKLDTISKKDLARMLLESEEEKEAMKLTIDAQTKELQASAPKVEYFDKVLESKGYLTVNMIAAELGISNIKLNRLLCDWGIQYKQTDCYFLYHKYRDRGYTVHRPHPYIDSAGQTKTRQHMYWTESGKRNVIELYNRKTGTA